MNPDDLEERIKADFQKHPGSWRPDPENWFREGWLAGFAAIERSLEGCAHHDYGICKCTEFCEGD